MRDDHRDPSPLFLLHCIQSPWDMSSLKEHFFVSPFLAEKRAEKADARQARTTERGAGLHAVITILPVARHDRSRKTPCRFSWPIAEAPG
jgi:hypothetical protein